MALYKAYLHFTNPPLVGPPGIEPGLHPPHGRVLPVYYGPYWTSNLTALPYYLPYS